MRSAALFGCHDPEIGNLGRVGVAHPRHEDVFTLDVAMHQPQRMRSLQPLCDAARNLQRPGHIEGPMRFPQEPAQVRPSTNSIEKNSESSSAGSKSPQSTTLRWRTWRSVLTSRRKRPVKAWSLENSLARNLSARNSSMSVCRARYRAHSALPQLALNAVNLANHHARSQIANLAQKPAMRRAACSAIGISGGALRAKFHRVASAIDS